MDYHSSFQEQHHNSHDHAHTGSQETDFILPLICIGLCLGYALTLWRKTSKKDYPEPFFIALCALPAVISSYFFHIYTQSKGGDPFILFLVGAGVCFAAITQDRKDCTLPEMPRATAWVAVSVLAAFPMLGSFAFFMAGLNYKLKIRHYLVPYFTMSGIIWLSSGALGQVFMHGSQIAVAPIMVLSVFAVSLVTPIGVWYLFERFQWKLIQLIGALQCTLAFFHIFYG